MFVILLEEETPAPAIVSSKNGGNVREGHTVYLTSTDGDNTTSPATAADDPADNVEVYYTTDGSEPVIGDAKTRLYTSELGIRLENPGLLFVRAITRVKGKLPSKPLTSK